MLRKHWCAGTLALLLFLAGAQAASAKYLYSYAVKFVCGYNNSNVGSSGSLLAGEPPVKFGLICPAIAGWSSPSNRSLNPQYSWDAADTSCSMLPNDGSLSASSSSVSRVDTHGTSRCRQDFVWSII